MDKLEKNAPLPNWITEAQNEWIDEPKKLSCQSFTVCYSCGCACDVCNIKKIFIPALDKPTVHVYNVYTYNNYNIDKFLYVYNCLYTYDIDTPT